MTSVRPTAAISHSTAATRPHQRARASSISAGATRAVPRIVPSGAASSTAAGSDDAPALGPSSTGASGVCTSTADTDWLGPAAVDSAASATTTPARRRVAVGSGDRLEPGEAQAERRRDEERRRAAGQARRRQRRRTPLPRQRHAVGVVDGERGHLADRGLQRADAIEQGAHRVGRSGGAGLDQRRVAGQPDRRGVEGRAQRRRRVTGCRRECGRGCRPRSTRASPARAAPRPAP